MNRKFSFNKSMLFAGLLSAMTLGATSQVYAVQSPDVQKMQQQTVKLTGNVSDAMGAIIGASVIEQGTTNGVITDIEGNFTLTVNRGAKLEISYVGYKTRVIEVTDVTHLQITLEEDYRELEEVVVVGYGVQKKKLVTSATVQVKGDDVTKLNTTSALGALQNQTPGINITANNGLPGEGFKVNIRGIGTVGDSAPLYVWPVATSIRSTRQILSLSMCSKMLLRLLFMVRVPLMVLSWLRPNKVRRARYSSVTTCITVGRTYIRCPTRSMRSNSWQLLMKPTSITVFRR